ncbi:anaerobic C4-dicarboxylate transporter family protein [Intrasporangium sp.]|uniref:anaerobic C4-dicarboxylate transporter family protein n=1 Tax=Intrasporangium sp. TaxID=1925024 RepID=UPI0032217199
MQLKFFVELAVVLAVIALGARKGGIALGLWGGVGVLVLTVVFREQPAAPPIDVMLIILAVISAAAAMEAAGGVAWLVGVAERIIRRYPQQITIVAPLVAYLFTFGAGTGHIFYPLLPVIHEVAHDNGIRPERPIAVATIASQQAITASPVSAAMAALIVILEPEGMTLTRIMLIAVPATLVGVVVAAVLSYRRGAELADDPVFRQRVEAGLVAPIPRRTELGRSHAGTAAALATAPRDEDDLLSEAAASDGGSATDPAAGPQPGRAAGRVSAWMFLLAVGSIIVLGAVPALRPSFPDAKTGELEPVSMALTIQITMLAVAALIVLVNRVDVDEIPRVPTARAGFVALVGIFGLAWLGQTLIAANEELVVGGLSDMAKAAPWTFAIGLFLASVLLFSQAATTQALMPLGLTLGIGGPALAAMWPAVNGYFFLPTYGTIIAAISFDQSGTTRIGRFVLNHSFMLPGLVATVTAVATGLGIAGLF